MDAPTEERHPGTTSIDTHTSLDILRALNAEDATVAGAVSEVLPELAHLVDRAVESLRAGGTVHYFGAGTSGRLAVLDAAELRPTFNAPAGLVVAHHAGGPEALLQAVENVEDDADLGRSEADDLRPGDVAIGLTASGRTPFVAGALARARERGAVTALVTANPDAELAVLADILLAVRTGPEALTGSTRLKAGTAQKLVLNSFSTAVMIRLGRTWSNLMVDVVATNAKLRGRVAAHPPGGHRRRRRPGPRGPRRGGRRAQARPALPARGRRRRHRPATRSPPTTAPSRRRWPPSAARSAAAPTP